MGRRYAKKIKSWTNENLQNALDAIEDGLPCKTAARRHGMPYSVLKWRLDKKLRCEPFTGQGRKRPLDSEEDKNFAYYIDTLCRFGFYPMCVDDFLDLTSYFIARRGLKGGIKNALPGKYWAEAFAQRHNISFKEMRMMNQAYTNPRFVRYPAVVQNFYNRLEEVTTDCNFGPNQIWTFYEIGVPNYLLGNDFSFDADAQESTSCIATCSASGQALAPLIIHAEQHSSIKRIDSTFCATSETGRLTPKLFQDWFNSFLNSVTARPLFILMDSALSHLSLDSVELARTEGIHFVKQPCCTKKPLDLCFDLFKIKWKSIMQTWVKENMILMSGKDFVKHLSSIWYKCLSQKLIVEGFEMSGVYPLDQRKFREALCADTSESSAVTPSSAIGAEKVAAGRMQETSDIVDRRVAAFNVCEDITSRENYAYNSRTYNMMKRNDSKLPCVSHSEKGDPVPESTLLATPSTKSSDYPCWCCRPPPSVPGKRWIPIWSLVDDETACTSASPHQIKDVRVVLEKIDFPVNGGLTKPRITSEHVTMNSQLPLKSKC